MKGERIKFFTSESVTEGHPDKICDQISDAILDALLAQDAAARSCCEVCVTTDLVVVIGEITTTANVDYEAVVRKTIREIGYVYPHLGFDADTCKIIIALDKQSADIANGVDNSSEYKQNNIDLNDKIGAGDQGMVFGCACNETEDLMPLPIYLAHKLTKRLTEVRKMGILDYLYPDGKSQVTVEYHNGKPARIDAVVISAHHNEFIDLEKLREDIKNEVILKIIPAKLIDNNTKFFINPAGKFVIGGAKADGGLTGRKIIVDTYGGFCPHGGGSLSGKDPTKVDRSAAYMARYICKNLVAAKIADRVEMQISYAIGVANPVSVYIDTFGSGKISDTKIEQLVKEVFDMRPKAIIDKLGLQNPIYRQTAAYGHFGRQGFPWEQTDMVEKLTEILQKYI